MTVFVKNPARKVVVVGWNQAEGLTVDIEVTEPDGNVETVKSQPNKGETDLYFPTDYAGTVTVTVQGSKPGSAADTGTISV